MVLRLNHSLFWLRRCRFKTPTCLRLLWRKFAGIHLTIQLWLRIMFYNELVDIHYVIDTLMEPIFWIVDNFTKTLGPIFVLGVSSIMVSVMFISYSIGLPYYWNKSPVFAIFVLVVGHWIFLNTAFHYVMGIIVSPGLPPTGSTINNAVGMCKKCVSPKPPRTHHCSVCNRCVLKMDHHCPWLDNCVGHFNHRYFFLYMVYTCCGALFVIIFGFEIAYDEMVNKGGLYGATDDVIYSDEYDSTLEGHPLRMVNGTHYIPVTEEGLTDTVEPSLEPKITIRKTNWYRGSIIYCALICVGVFAALGSLALWHANLITKGETSIEAHINKAETKRLAQYQMTYRNPYDFGPKRNWIVFLGLVNGRSFWRNVLLPSRFSPEGNGLTWRTIYNDDSFSECSGVTTSQGKLIKGT